MQEKVKRHFAGQWRHCSLWILKTLAGSLFVKISVQDPLITSVIVLDFTLRPFCESYHAACCPHISGLQESKQKLDNTEKHHELMLTGGSEDCD